MVFTPTLPLPKRRVKSVLSLIGATESLRVDQRMLRRLTFLHDDAEDDAGLDVVSLACSKTGGLDVSYI